jgi:nicotinamide-nucleotide adenylyltransferase
MRGLFLGRFQPFHKGHLEGVTHILNECPSVLIVISSAHVCHTVDDPFTGGERYEMIKATLLDQGMTPDRYDIIPVGFYRSTPDFMASVMSLSPPFHRVYTANPQVASLFSSWNHEVWPTQSQPTSRLTSGTEVRRKMAANADWEPLVPEAVARVIRRIDGVRRLQLLHSDND